MQNDAKQIKAKQNTANTLNKTRQTRDSTRAQHDKQHSKTKHSKTEQHKTNQHDNKVKQHHITLNDTMQHTAKRSEANAAQGELLDET